MIVDDDEAEDADDRVERRIGGSNDDRDRGVRSPENADDYDDDDDAY